MWGVSWAPIWGCKIADLRTGPGRRDTAFGLGSLPIFGAPRPPAAAQALSAIRVAIHLIVRILDPSREFYAARLASGNQL